MLINKKMCVNTLGPGLEENEFEFIVKGVTNSDLTKLLKPTKTFGSVSIETNMHHAYSLPGCPFCLNDTLVDFCTIRLHTSGKLYHDYNVKRRIQSIFKDRLCREKS